MTVGKTLKNIRIRLGHSSARSFYLGHLEKNGLQGMNYAYYMKVENDEALPSPTAISAIGATLGRPDRRALILIYCETLFPNDKSLFTKGPQEKVPERVSEDTSYGTATSPSQQVLSQRQVAKILESIQHYALFLVIEMARYPVSIETIQKFLPKADVLSLVGEFERLRLVRVDDGNVSPVSTEVKFPPADNKALESLYAQMDLWAPSIDGMLSLQKQRQKVLVRRISERYLSLIARQTDLLVDLIKASEEVDPVHNDQVVTLNLSLFSGPVPG